MFRNIISLLIIVFINIHCGGHYYGMGDCYEEDFSEKTVPNDLEELKGSLWHIKGELRSGDCVIPQEDPIGW